MAAPIILTGTHCGLGRWIEVISSTIQGGGSSPSCPSVGCSHTFSFPFSVPGPHFVQWLSPSFSVRLSLYTSLARPLSFPARLSSLVERRIRRCTTKNMKRKKKNYITSWERRLMVLTVSVWRGRLRNLLIGVEVVVFPSIRVKRWEFEDRG